MDIGTAESRPGEVATGYVELTQLPTGVPERAPVVVAEGRRPGPTLWVTATIHGDEVTSLAAAQDFVDRIDPDELAGRVVCLPNLNPAGLRRNRRTSYYHDDDPNRYFPVTNAAETADATNDSDTADDSDAANAADAADTAANDADASDTADATADADSTRPPRVQEVVAERLFELIADSADAVISLHSSWAGSSSYLIRPRITYGEDRTREEADAIAERLVDLTEAFGLPVINQFGHRRAETEQLHRTLTGAAVSEAGIPAFTPELGGRYVVEEDACRAAVEGLENVLRVLEMVDEPPRTDSQIEPPIEPPLKRAIHPYTDTPGIVRYRVDAGDVLEAGDTVADIVTPHGERKTTIRTDHEGYVLSRHEGVAAYENDPLLDLAVPDDESLVVPAESRD